MRMMSDEDLEALIARLKAKSKGNTTEDELEKLPLSVSCRDNEFEDCRFKALKPEDIMAAVEFYKNFNKFCEESKLTVWKTLLKYGVAFTLGLIALGIWAKTGVSLDKFLDK